MASLKDWLRFLRAPNLAIVALTQYLVRHAVLGPVYAQTDQSMDLGPLAFSCLVATTVLVTAGGYLINDYYDAQVDRLNRPDRVFVDRLVSAIRLLGIYAAMLVAGGVLAIGLAIRLDYLQWLFLYPVSVAGLWAYSATLKRTPLWGNVVVALFSAGVVLIVWLAEARSFAELQTQDPQAAGLLTATFLFYAAFAFLSTLFRELVKDLEDIRGDAASGCRTLPIAIGEARARTVALGILALLGMAIAVFLWQAGSGLGMVAQLYAVIGLLAPAAYLGSGLLAAGSPAAYHRVSTQTKVLMVVGLLFLPVIALT